MCAQYMNIYIVITSKRYFSEDRLVLIHRKLFFPLGLLNNGIGDMVKIMMHATPINL